MLNQILNLKFLLTTYKLFKYQRRKYAVAEFANSIDLDEVAHHEPPHLDLNYLPSSL